MPALRIKLPNTGETTHLLRGDRVSVGRSADNNIQIAHASISSHHAELVAVDGRYLLRDLHSTNRSYVEGKPVTDCELRGPCTILFGSVECEFDPAAAPMVKRVALPSALRERVPANLVYLESENRELRQQVHAMQRHFDVLGSTRPRAGKGAAAPPAAIKTASAERDELRQENGLLKVQISALQAELAAARAALPVPSATVADEDSAVPKTAGPADLDSLRRPLASLNAAVEAWAAAPADGAQLSRLGAEVTALADAADAFGSHPFRRITRGLRELLQDLARSGQPPALATARTVRGTVEFLGLLLQPARFAAGGRLPVGQVLVIDDDADILSTVTDSLMTAHLDVTGCLTAEDALVAVEAQRFDTILADVRLPGMNGPAFCARTRELPAYRRTPILFLTGGDTIDARAETSLSGGNEFLAKPFNVFELALKVETWVLRQQLRMV